MTPALAPCGECNLGECDRCPMCRRFEEIAEKRAKAVWDSLEASPEFVAGMARGRADFEAGRVTPYRHIAERPDRTGYATRNVVRVEAPEAEAMAAWLDAIEWLEA